MPDDPRPPDSHLRTVAEQATFWSLVATAANMFRESQTVDHFVFTPDAVPLLPAALVQENAQDKLRVITTTADFFVVLGADGSTAYDLPVRSVALHDTRARAQ